MLNLKLVYYENEILAYFQRDFAFSVVGLKQGSKNIFDVRVQFLEVNRTVSNWILTKQNICYFLPNFAVPL